MQVWITEEKVILLWSRVGCFFCLNKWGESYTMEWSWLLPLFEYMRSKLYILLCNGVGCFFCWNTWGVSYTAMEWSWRLLLFISTHTRTHTQNLEWRFIALKMSQHPQKKMAMWKVDRQNLAGLNDVCTSLVKSGTPDQRQSFRPPFSKRFPCYFQEMNPCSKTTPLLRAFLLDLYSLW